MKVKAAKTIVNKTRAAMTQSTGRRDLFESSS